MNITSQKLREAFNSLLEEALASGRPAEAAACIAALGLPEVSMERLAQAFSKAAAQHLHVNA